MYPASQLLEKINAYIDALPFERQPKGLYAPIEYVLSLGGKRVRPVLMQLAYNIYKENVDAILPVAASIEMYHNYTLLHDDLMDKADLRRNKPTVHKLWNDNTAILSGDTMLVLAYHLLAQCKAEYLKKVLDTFNTTAVEIGEGQQYDMEFETRNDVTEAEYLEMIRLKTSVLLAASLKMGAQLADAPLEDVEELYDLGIRIGLAFQLQDDYLDVYGDTATFGKNIGGDILCNKKTYMLINALLLANPVQREELEKWITAVDFQPAEKIRAVTALYDAIGIKELCQKKIELYFEEGMACLNRLQVDEERKQVLRTFVLTLMGRNV